MQNSKTRKTLTLKWLLLSMAFTMPAIIHAQNLLHAPQKIVIDAPRNRLLVSNDTITGDIVQIDSAGNQTYFVQGAGFIDGMEIVGDTVYGVCKNRKIKAYNLVTKDLVMNITIPGLASKYLSSITSDSAGHLFISCPKLNEIYKVRISDQSWWLFASGNGLNNPNGILLEREQNRIVVIGDSPIPSSIYAISLSDSTVSTLMSTSFNSPDGIVRDKYGYYYVGGYYLQAIFIIDPGFNQPPVSFFPGTSMVYPTYDIRDHSLLITHYNANTWERVPLTTTGTGKLKLPAGFNLHPVSPNPFSSGLTIRFELNNRMLARLDVYDSTGSLAVNLLNAEKEPGSYSVSWDGKNTSGQQLPGGVYYIRLKADNAVQTQKVVLAR
jgi:hypothetical protein